MPPFDNHRYADRLAAAERAAAPHLADLGLTGAAVEPFGSFTTAARSVDSGVLDEATGIPSDAIPAVRIVLLRRIAESETGTGDSTHGLIRAALAAGRAEMGPADLAIELALCRFAIDFGFGIGLSWKRLPLLDPTLAALDLVASGDAAAVVASEAEQLVDLLANETMAMEAGSTDRRFRLLGFLQRIGPGALPAVAFDPADPFGQTMRTVVETDPRLGRDLALVLPLAAKATTSTPDRRQRARIEAILADGHTVEALRGAVSRCIHHLLAAPLHPRGPGFVTVRPTNQRIGRAVLWLVPALLPAEAPELLGDVGVRLGTSGRRDN